MGLVVLVVFLVLPIVEIYVIVQVGQAIGAVPTVLLLLLGAVVGATIIRRAGAKAWRAMRAAVNAGRVPTREIADGACVVAGGALLVVPGFVTDAAGLILVLPFTRPLARRLLARSMTPPVVLRGRRRPAGGPGEVIEGEVVEPDPAPDANRPDQIGRAG